MKTATYIIAAAAGVASAVAEESKKWTKQELEESTKAFVKENKRHVKLVRNKNLRKLKASRSDTWQRRKLSGGKGGKTPNAWDGSTGWGDSEDSDWSGGDWRGRGSGGREPGGTAGSVRAVEWEG